MAGPDAGSARLFYAYADALLDAGREEEARDWFGRAAAADTRDETDAAERFEELDQVDFADLDEFDDLDEPADLDELGGPGGFCWPGGVRRRWRARRVKAGRCSIH